MNRVLRCLDTARLAAWRWGGGAIVLGALAAAGCDATALARREPAQVSGEPKVGVMLVSHGSRSARWRQSLLEIEEAVRDRILADGRVARVTSAFMEYNEPSIATRLAEFDRDGCADVVAVPLLLTVSSHSFDDIPTIAGQKEDRAALEALRVQGIDIYRPRARFTMAPLLDFADALAHNVVRRVCELSQDPPQEGVVLVAYGDEQYDDEWRALLERVGQAIRQRAGIDVCTHCWCGHVVRYQTEPTEEAIRRVLRQRPTAIVVPVLVAVDERFQIEIIGRAVSKVAAEGRVRYRPDAILPDARINDWVEQIALQTAARLAATPAGETPASAP